MLTLMCSRCLEIKPENQFPSGYRCRSCAREVRNLYRRRRYHTDPAYREASIRKAKESYHRRHNNA